MPKRLQLSSSISQSTRDQVDLLTQTRGYSVRDVITVAIDRLYREEQAKMKIKSFRNLAEAKAYAEANASKEFRPTIYARNCGDGKPEYAVSSYPAPELGEDDEWEGGYTTGAEAIIERDDDGTYRYVLAGISDAVIAWESDDVTGFASEAEAIEAAREHYREANEE